MRRRSFRGFTLVELVVVIVVIAILAAIILPLVDDSADDSAGGAATPGVAVAQEPGPGSGAPPNSGGWDFVSFDPSVPTRWVQDHQDQFGFGGVKSIEHVSMMQGEVVSAGVIGDIYVRHYTVHTRDRGALEIMTDVPNYGGSPCGASTPACPSSPLR